MGFKDVNTIGKPSVCGQPEMFGSRVADMLERDFVSIGTIEISLALSQQPGLTFGAANSFGLTYKVGEVIGLYTRFLREGPTPQELARVKANHLADFVRTTETVGGAEGKSRLLAEGQTYFSRTTATQH